MIYSAVFNSYLHEAWLFNIRLIKEYAVTVQVKLILGIWYYQAGKQVWHTS